MNAKRVLELGTFTGYSALCLAEGLRGVSEAAVVTCDIDRDALQIARTYFDQSDLKELIDLRQDDAARPLPASP